MGLFLNLTVVLSVGPDRKQPPSLDLTGGFSMIRRVVLTLILLGLAIMAGLILAAPTASQRVSPIPMPIVTVVRQTPQLGTPVVATAPVSPIGNPGQQSLPETVDETQPGNQDGERVFRVLIKASQFNPFGLRGQ